MTPVSPEAGLVTFAWSIVNQDDRVVCRARVEVLCRIDGEADLETGRTEETEFVPIPL